MPLLLTCEHASNAVPPHLAEIFSSQQALLKSHRGWDAGAWAVYNDLCERLHPAYAAAGCYTRLAIELNRSLHHPSLFSFLTKNRPVAERQLLIDEIWTPFRESVHQRIAVELKNAKASVLHLSIHSFTPEFRGEIRDCEIGLLYDPARAAEKSLARQWQSTLRRTHPDLRVRLNYPYRGNADGHTTALRKEFGPRYLGFEIELKQDWLVKHSAEEVGEILAGMLDFAPERGGPVAGMRKSPPTYC
jgi:predicted N-formylglutamate amidohydrolase